MDLNKGLYRFLAKVLVFVMLVQGMPLWELSQTYEWDPERGLKFLKVITGLLGPKEAYAADVTDDIELVRGRLRYDRSSRISYVDIQLRNISTETVSSPIQVIIDSVTDPTVTVANPDGTTPEGKPYFEYILASGSLSPGETSDAKTWRFNNPNRRRFDYVIGSIEADVETGEPDRDEDGIPDASDNCPDTPNPDQADTDGDGLGDVCDNCPEDPDKTETGICGCGVADTDSDGDGERDCNDGCPQDPTKTEPGTCGCGIVDTDSDNDGTPDCNDDCPDDPNKTEPGTCGCGVVDDDSDLDNDGIVDCLDDQINVSPEMDPINDQQMNEGASLDIPVSATDPEGDTLVLTFSGLPAFANATDNGDGTGVITCEPGFDDEGAYPIMASVSDGEFSDSIHFTLTVIGINGPPVAEDDAYEARNGRILTAPAPGVMENDSDPDDDPLMAVLQSPPLNGALDLNEDGSFEFTPEVPPPGTLDFLLKYKYGADEAAGDSPVVYDHPLVVDLDHNDVPDIFFRTGNNRLVALRGDTGELLFKRETGGPGSTSNGRAATGDIDLDGRPEIILVGTEPGRSGTQWGLKIVAYEDTGDIKWISESLPSSYRHSHDPNHATSDGNFRDSGVIIADIDMDGTPEVIVGHGAEGVVGVTVFDNNGQKRWTRISTRSRGCGCSNPNALPAVADIDLDGFPEIIYLNSAFSHTGEVLWQADFRPMYDVAIANLDDDPYGEVLFAGYSYIYLMEHDGTVKWNLSVNTFKCQWVPTIADFNSDGLPEIGMTGGSWRDYHYTVLNRDGTLLWQTEINHPKTGATVFDLDRDGTNEVIFSDVLSGAYDMLIRIWDGRDGSEKMSFDPNWQGSAAWSFPIMADVDADGHAEMVLVGPSSTVYGGLYVYEGTNNDWSPVRSVWNQYPYHVTNVNPDGTIPVYVEPHWLIPGLNNFRINERMPEPRETTFDNFTYLVNDGQADSNEATVDLTVLPVNTPPQIVSSPVNFATAGYPYLYRVFATDTDPGETLVFDLPSAPAGMTINPDTGLIEWTPEESQLGGQPVGIMVTDSQNESAVQEFTLTVEMPLTVPDVTGLMEADAELLLTAVGFTAGDVSSRPSPTEPMGTVLEQNPAAGMTGPRGSKVNLIVSSGVDTEPPVVYVAANPARIATGGSTLVTVNASDDSAIVGRSLTIDGVSFSLDGNNQAFFTSGTPGVYPAVGTATDEYGNTAESATNIFVVIPGDTDPPEVSLFNLGDGDFVSNILEVIGTANDINFYQYSLEIKQQGGVWTILAQGTTPVVDDVLGTIDPTIMIDDPYQLKLSASDLNGNYSELTIDIGIVSENLKIGHFTVSFTDLQIPVSGIPISVIRTYDSRQKVKQDFGIGWNMSIKTTDVTEDEDMNVFITLPDGRRTAFTFTPIYLGIMSPDIPLYRPAFTSSAGVVYELTCPGCDGIEVTDYWADTPGADCDWIDPITFECFNPETYILTVLDGTEYNIDEVDGLQEVKDLNDNTLTFTYDGIFHSSGKSVEFIRDGLGRITGIIDPMGNTIVYAYDENGDLVDVIDREGHTSTYTYDANHYMVDMFTPDGVRAARNEYDANGRIIASTDANGNLIEYAHDLDTRQEVVTDRLGGITVYEYDDRGNVISQTDPLGNLTTYLYDANNNKTSETDPLGNTTTYIYDSNNNPLSATDPLGDTTTHTYDAGGNLLSTTDPNGNTTSYTYNPSGNLLTTVDPLGNVTSYTYDGSGNRLTITDPMGNVTTFAYDADGNVTTETDALGHSTAFTYDANGNKLSESMTRTSVSGPETLTTTYIYDNEGRLLQTIDPDGGSSTTEYNSLGNKSAFIDKNGNRTLYNYDTAGNHTSTVYPDGSIEISTFDANGNEISKTDRAGNTTAFEYNSRGRPQNYSLPNGSTRAFEYDAAGKMTAIIVETGGRLEREYDASGRMIRLIDALGNITLFTYDGNGNRLSMTDANGNTTLFEYDGLNRMTSTIFPDGTVSETVYEAGFEKRILSEVDQAGNATQFEYDALGRLTVVIDAMGNTTTYAYDEVGNKLTETDANGNTTTWEYDNVGRVVRRILPLSMSEVFTYDANGNVLTKTDFNGDTISYTYDTENRIIQKLYPDSTVISYTYTPTGRPLEVTDSRGITSFDYDSRTLLSNVTEPDGRTISYTYDELGNRASMTTTSGTTLYSYDALHRLENVTGPDGGITAYTYDNVGNRASVIYPNGAETTYVYNSLNRLTNIENRRSDSTIISSYSYSLGLTGNRLQVIENSGRTVNYTYDSVYRLTHEEIADPVLGNNNISYTYDPVGNRLSKTDLSGVTSYTYDINNRLTSDGINIYSYDNNGNTISRSDAFNTTEFWYDFENRLITVQTPGSLISYYYDADGNRIRTDADGVVTDYLVDRNRDYAQVLEETDSLGALQSEYIYGDDLISQNRAGQISYYIYDGHGSVRQLIDDTTTVTDTYTYDAFGIELGRTGTTPNTYLYAGEQYDPNAGFYYLRARYYDMQNGRFISPDVFQGNIFEPLSLHKYLYAETDPVNNIDPSGYVVTLPQIMIGVGIAALLLAHIVPNVMKARTKAAGDTNQFKMTLMLGVSGGAVWYAGVLTATIEEEGHTSVRQNVMGRKVGVYRYGNFVIILIGVGGGFLAKSTIGVPIVSMSSSFTTEGNRKIEQFNGIGRITAVDIAYGVGAGGSVMQLADGTDVPFSVSLAVSLSKGVSGYSAMAIWYSDETHEGIRPLE